MKKTLPGPAAPKKIFGVLTGLWISPTGKHKKRSRPLLTSPDRYYQRGPQAIDSPRWFGAECRLLRRDMKSGFTACAAVASCFLFVGVFVFVKPSQHSLVSAMVMPSWFTAYMNGKPARFGTLLALAGILVLTPDTLVIRLSGLERWTLMGWRGLLMGVMSFAIWWVLFTRQPWRDLSTIMTWQGLFVIATFSLNSVTFTLGIVETSASVVLTAVATMPVFAAILSAFLLQERQGWRGWAAIFTAMAGVGIVVADGSSAIGQPDGSVILGALYGVLTAIGLAVTFTFARKYPWLAILPAAAFGAFISGMIGLSLAEQDKIFDVPLWTVLTMGLVLLPVSFTCLNLAPHYTSAAVVSLVMLLEMVIGPFWVWLGIGERPSPMMMGGTTIALAALGFHIIRTQWFAASQTNTD